MNETTQLPPPTNLDPKVVKVMQAIRQVESGGDYNSVGDGGRSAGAFQWNNGSEQIKPGETPQNWKVAAQKYLGDSNAQMTKENQNYVAYHQILDYKNQGLNPDEIDAVWNGAHKDDTGRFVHNNPQRAQEFRNAVLGSPKTSSITDTQDSTQQPAENGTQPDFLSEASKNITDTGQGISTAAQQAISGQISPISGVVQSAGALAGGIGSLANTALEHIPVVGGVVKGAEDVIGGAVKGAIQTPTGQMIAQPIQSQIQAHPELASDIGSIGNIAALLYGGSAVKNVLGSVIEKGLYGGGADALTEMVSPKMTPSRIEQAIASRGTTKSGLLGKIRVATDPKMEDIASAVKENVPKVNPNKPITTNITYIKNAELKMRSAIQSDLEKEAEGMIYSPNELKGVLNGIEAPISVRGTPFEKQIAPMKNAVLQIAQNTGYKVADLLRVRKQFDSLIEGAYGDVFDKANSPILPVIRGVREALTSFTEHRAPTSNLKSRLVTQSKLIRAVENMSEKAASGAEKEIGSTAMSRFGQRHPYTRGLVRTIGRGALLGTGIKGAENLIP